VLDAIVGPKAREALKPIRIAIYSRYSGKNQSPMSAKDQADRAVKFVRKQSIPFINFPYSNFDFKKAEFLFFSDEAKSGTRVGRAGYDAFKKCLELGECNVALVDDLSRIVRDLGEQMDVYHLLKYKEVELYSVCDQISSEGPYGQSAFPNQGYSQRNGTRSKCGQNSERA
jgi:DNA invertase Pin-like site-specific DNA recombinase